MEMYGKASMGVRIAQVDQNVWTRFDASVNCSSGSKSLEKCCYD